MIVYGHRAKKIASESIANPCPSCGNRAVELQVYQRYAHIFWIPAFPMKKLGATVCHHCKQVVESKNFAPDIAATYDAVRAQHRPPVWTFSAAIIFAILIGAAGIASQQNGKRNSAYASAPQAGDVYEMKLADGEYTLYRVTGLRGDSVMVQPHSMMTNKASGLNSLKKKGESSWVPESFGYSLTEIGSMLKEGSIRDIDRK